MSILILVRHGQSTYNLENRFTGNVDVDLSPLGIEEAELAGQKLKDYVFDLAYTSMLKRAQKSLEIILGVIHQQNIPIVKNAALDERMYGNLQGLNKDETSLKYGDAQVEIWRRSYGIKPPGGESLQDTYNRTVPYYQQQIAPQLAAGKTVLVVAHGNSLRALKMYLENIDETAIESVNIPTGTPCLYTFDQNNKLLTASYL